MKILAIEASSIIASIAIVTEENLIAEYTINYKKTHSQTLLPMIDNICKITQINPEEIDAIAVSKGPGSFTGLRIGSATAKGFALALNKPIISVPTLEAMSYNFYYTNKIICPIMDARRKQVYTGIYKFENEKIIKLLEQTVIPIEEIVDKLNAIGKEVIFTGDGIAPYKEYIDKNITCKCFYARQNVNGQRAAALAMGAFEYYKLGIIEDGKDHKPDYLRLSQAERELAEKKNGNI